MCMTKVYCLMFMAGLFFVSACGSTNNDTDPSDAETASITNRLGAVAPQILRSVDHGGGIGWKKDKCILCHTMTELRSVHEHCLALPASFSMFDVTDTGLCLYCHGSNGLTDVTAETYQCLRCHTDNTIVDSAQMFAGCNMHDMNGDGLIGNADCVICHAFTDMNGEIDLAIDFRRGASDYKNVSEFCLNCHDGNGAFGILPPELSTGSEGGNIYSTYNGIGKTSSVQCQTADYHGSRNGTRHRHAGSGSEAGEGQGSGAGTGEGQGSGSGTGEGQGSDSWTEEEPRLAELRGTYSSGMEVACLDCHQVHSSDNPYLITQSGASAEFADNTAKAATVMVSENDFTQLCAVCHMSPEGAPTDNGLTQVVHPNTYSTYCTDCHYHGAGFGENISGLF